MLVHMNIAHLSFVGNYASLYQQVRYLLANLRLEFIALGANIFTKTDYSALVFII